MTLHERHGVWDHRSIECLFNSFFGLTSKEHQQSALHTLYERNPPVERFPSQKAIDAPPYHGFLNANTPLDSQNSKSAHTCNATRKPPSGSIMIDNKPLLSWGRHRRENKCNSAHYWCGKCFLTSTAVSMNRRWTQGIGDQLHPIEFMAVVTYRMGHFLRPPLWVAKYDDVIKCKHFPRNWPFVTKTSDAELWCFLWSALE